MSLKKPRGGRENKYRLRDQELVSLPIIIDIYRKPIDISDEIEHPIYTFGFVKPHAYSKREEILHDIYEISSRLGIPLHVIHQRDYTFTEEVAALHYNAHRNKPFFDSLIRMITEGPVYQFIISGERAIPTFRKIVGATKKPAKGTLRYKYSETEKGLQYNAIHASDSPGGFLEEVEIHFSRAELVELGEHFWKRIDAYKKLIQHCRHW